jgi:hypothetical protein
MPTEKILAEFKQCPMCQSESTVSQIGTVDAKAKGKIPVEAFTCLEMRLVPIEQPAKAILTVESIVTYHDVCGFCGTPRCTRATLLNAPIQMQPGQGQNHGGGNPFRRN